MDDDRTRLMFGPYITPAFAYGDTVVCTIRGDLDLVGLTDAPIPWPVGKGGRHRSIVLNAGLADAVRRESALAVARWWGVTSRDAPRREKIRAAKAGKPRPRHVIEASAWGEPAKRRRGE